MSDPDTDTDTSFFQKCRYYYYYVAFKTLLAFKEEAKAVCGMYCM